MSFAIVSRKLTEIKPAYLLCRQPAETDQATSGNIEDGCSESSEVDWSWVEKVECLRASESRVAKGGERAELETGSTPASPTNENTGRKRDCERRETVASRSVAMSVTATAKSVVGVSLCPSLGSTLLDNQNYSNSCRQHHRQRNDDSNNNDYNDETITRCNATNEAVDRENRDHGTTITTATATIITGSVTANSWIRASMRRLRHLRLPDGTQRDGGNDTVNNNRRAVAVSAPNSLPDIALIAPEVLAAQTNGSGTSDPRPSSAPARNAVVTISASTAPPRRTGRQLAGRSRGARNQETSSRQGSLGSTTTVSDITALGSTTCSSSFDGGSISLTPSTTISPQRAASRR